MKKGYSLIIFKFLQRKITLVDKAGSNSSIDEKRQKLVGTIYMVN